MWILNKPSEDAVDTTGDAPAVEVLAGGGTGDDDRDFLAAGQSVSVVFRFWAWKMYHIYQ